MNITNACRHRCFKQFFGTGAIAMALTLAEWLYYWATQGTITRAIASGGYRVDHRWDLLVIWSLLFAAVFLVNELTDVISCCCAVFCFIGAIATLKMGRGAIIIVIPDCIAIATIISIAVLLGMACLRLISFCASRWRSRNGAP